jgi:hypothetical protein
MQWIDFTVEGRSATVSGFVLQIASTPATRVFMGPSGTVATGQAYGDRLTEVWDIIDMSGVDDAIIVESNDETDTAGGVALSRPAFGEPIEEVRRVTSREGGRQSFTMAHKGLVIR